MNVEVPEHIGKQILAHLDANPEWENPADVIEYLLAAYQDIAIDADCQSVAESYIEQFKLFRGMVTDWTVEELLTDRREGLE